MKRSFPSAAWLVLFAGGIAQLAMLVAVKFPPIQDYPNHLLRVHASRSLETVPVYSHHLAHDLAFRPNVLGDWLVEGLSTFLPLALAGKASLCLAVLLACAALGYYLETFGGGILGALLGLQLTGAWLFHKGFLNNYVAVSLGLLYLCLLWPRNSSLSRGRYLLAVAASLAMAAAHAFVYGAVVSIAVVAALLQVGESWRRRFSRLSTVLPGVVIGAVYVLQQADSGLLANRPIFDWSWRALLFWQPVGTFLSFPDRGDVWIALLCLLLLVTSCLALLRSHLSEGSSWRRDVVLLFVSTAFVLYLLSPDSLSGGWSHGRLRMLHLMVLISLPTLTIVPRGLVRRVLIAGMGLVLIVNLSGIWSNYRSFQQGATDFVALASALPPGQLLLTLDLESPPDDRIRPGLHLWSYVCIERDCLSPFLFANRYAQNLYFVRMPEWPPEGALTPSDWRAIIRLLDRGDYDGVLLHGRSEEGEAVLASVLDTVAESPAGALYLRSSARERPGRH